MKKNKTHNWYTNIFILFITLLFSIIAMDTITNIVKADTALPMLHYEPIEKDGVQGYKITEFQLINAKNTDLIISSSNTPDKKPVLEIDEMAFSGSVLNSITIKDSGYPINISSNAFNSCTVNNIILSESVTFNDSNSTEIDSQTGNGISISVFSSCDSLKSITIPSNMTVVSKDMFSYCRELSEIKTVTDKINFLPKQIERIGESAFKLCQSLPSLTISENLKSLGSQAFADWTNSQTIYFDLFNVPNEWDTPNIRGEAQVKGRE